ncbi:MAG TPA: hypothetical protein VGR12_03345 [Solirubrobacteraceae bacterium]|nr:hypothetical protein [Solirubrobacteraceae bacterium]
MAATRTPFSLPRQLSTAGALLLVVSLFLGWYGVDLDAARVREVEDLSDGALSRGRLTGWEAFSSIDVVVAACAVAGAVAGLVPVLRGGAELVPWASGVAMVAGLLALVLVVYRVVDQPGPDSVLSFRIGVFVALIGAFVMTYGAVRAWQGRDRGSGP